MNFVLDQETIDNLNTPYLFDISVFHTLESNSLLEHIDRVGKIFYKKGQ